IHRGWDVVFKSPTSTGKSQVIDYLDCLLDDGVIITIGPLRVLLKEYVQRFGDRATHVDANHKDPALLASIRDGKFRFVFTTAESATEGAFLNQVLMHEKFRKKVKAFVFDEAHTLDQWGRDFRPKFLQLGHVRKHLSAPVLIMSATLTKVAQQLCETTLQLFKPLVVDVGTDRPNIFLRVQPIMYAESSFLDILTALPQLWEPAGDEQTMDQRRQEFRPTVIFVNNKETATSMVYRLQQWCKRAGFGDVVDVFHADMSEKHKGIVRERLDNGSTLIAVCTDAFGMGANCRVLLDMFQWKMYGGVSAYWQRTGRCGRKFNDRAVATLFVDSTHIDSELKKTLTTTGQLPGDDEAEDRARESTSLEEDVRMMRGEKKAGDRQVADDEMIALARHGLARDACLRKLVLEHLGQPSIDKLPTLAELFGAGPNDDGSDLPCCSTCDPYDLSVLPKDLHAPKENVPLLKDLVATQKILRPRLEEWRRKQYKESWRRAGGAGRLGINAYMSLMDIDAVVCNLKIIANNISNGDSRLSDIVNMPFKETVLGPLEVEIKNVLREAEDEREAARKAQEEQRRQRAEDTRKRQADRRDQRTRAEMQQRVQQAESSSSSSSTRTRACTTCTDINSHLPPTDEKLEARGHNSKASD
ncbi:unnamed protein product, partial [Tilletia caries]